MSPFLNQNLFSDVGNESSPLPEEHWINTPIQVRFPVMKGQSVQGFISYDRTYKHQNRGYIYITDIAGNCYERLK